MYEDFQARYIQNQLRKLEGEELTIEEIIRRRNDNRERARINFYTIEGQITLLRESGFKNADCVWKHYNIAIVVGLKNK